MLMMRECYECTSEKSDKINANARYYRKSTRKTSLLPLTVDDKIGNRYLPDILNYVATAERLVRDAKCLQVVKSLQT